MSASAAVVAEPAGLTQGFVTVAGIVGGGRPGPARIFPLGLRRQTISLFFRFAELTAKLFGVGPGNSLHRKVPRIDTGYIRFAVPLGRKPAGVCAHEALI